jgi:hypothetical protein
MYIGRGRDHKIDFQEKIAENGHHYIGHGGLIQHMLRPFLMKQPTYCYKIALRYW